MAHRKKTSRRGNNAPTNSTRASRKSKAQVSSASIESVRRIVDILKPYELSETQRLRTYQAMLRDDAVWTPYDSRSKLIEKAQSKGFFKFDKNSPASVELHEFFQYNMAHLVDQTPRSIGRAANEAMINGIAPFEKILHKGDGKFADRWVLKKLSYIHPLSLDQLRPFEISQDGNSIVNLRQSTGSFIGNGDQFARFKFGTREIIKIPWNKIAHVSYSSSSTQPFGVSPLDAAYTAWREKVLFQDYALVGVTKDFAGTPVLYLPSAILDKAESSPNSPEAVMVSELQAGMANMHTGDQNFMILPSDTQSESGVGLRDFEIKFLGVEGGGKGFNITELVEQRKKAIYNVLGSSNLLSGEDGGGSYNLLEGKSNIQTFYVEADNANIEEMWNKQVFPTILRINEMFPEEKDIPIWVSGPIQPLSIDEVSKSLQRTAATGLLPKNDPVFLNEAYEKLGYSYRFDENMTPEEIARLTGDNDSRSGDGMASGLNNSTSKVTSGDTSTANKENS